MAIAALHSASTGLSALSTDLDVIAHNLANANTDGFKSSRTNFQDLMYLEKAQPGVENLLGQQRPTGVYVGLGVKVSGTQLDFTQGAPIPTERPRSVRSEELDRPVHAHADLAAPTFERRQHATTGQPAGRQHPGTDRRAPGGRLRNLRVRAGPRSDRPDR